MKIRFFDAENFNHGGLGDFTFEVVPVPGDIVELDGSYFKTIQRVIKEQVVLIDVQRIEISDNYVSFSRAL